MERINRPIAVVAIPAVALLAAACGGGQPPDAGQPGFPVTVERADGRELTFEAPPRRIISLSPGHTEILFAIGVGDRVIAVDTQSDFPPEAATKTKFDAMGPDVGAIDELQPDLIVLMAGPDAVVEALDQRGDRAG